MSKKKPVSLNIAIGNLVYNSNLTCEFKSINSGHQEKNSKFDIEMSRKMLAARDKNQTTK